jgi:hypothetical protein
MEPENKKSDMLAQLEDLPSVVTERLNKDQKKYLQFERKVFKIIGTPRVQTFHVGSLGKGSTVGGGLGKSLGDTWGVFGNLSSMNMATLNKFRTDIQLRLEDEETHERIFFEKSFPVEMTLSIETGDTFSIFEVRAEDQNLDEKNKRFLKWTPFIARVDETKQFIPLDTVPSVIIPESEYIEAPSDFPWLGFIIGFVVIAVVFVIFAEIGSGSSNNANSSPTSPSVDMSATTSQ